MFVANVLTIWIEALKAVFDSDHPVPEMQGLPVTPEFPMESAQYPGLWVNFAVQGDTRNVGIGHVEYTDPSDPDTPGLKPVYRWQFGGLVEVTCGAMSNLERARLLDEVTRSIAVARVDENAEGDLRETVERNGLVGMNVIWESFTIGGFAETPGTPWQTDDVIYEATVTLEVEGEVVLDPHLGELVPLSEIIFTPINELDPTETESLPTPGQGGWQ